MTIYSYTQISFRLNTLNCSFFQNFWQENLFPFLLSFLPATFSLSWSKDAVFLGSVQPPPVQLCHTSLTSLPSQLVGSLGNQKITDSSKLFIKKPTLLKNCDSGCCLALAGHGFLFHLNPHLSYFHLFHFFLLHPHLFRVYLCCFFLHHLYPHHTNIHPHHLHNNIIFCAKIFIWVLVPWERCFKILRIRLRTFYRKES